MKSSWHATASHRFCHEWVFADGTAAWEKLCSQKKFESYVDRADHEFAFV